MHLFQKTNVDFDLLIRVADHHFPMLYSQEFSYPSCLIHLHRCPSKFNFGLHYYFG